MITNLNKKIIFLNFLLYFFIKKIFILYYTKFIANRYGLHLSLATRNKNLNKKVYKFGLSSISNYSLVSLNKHKHYERGGGSAGN